MKKALHVGFILKPRNEEGADQDLELARRIWRSPRWAESHYIANVRYNNLMKPKGDST